MWLYENTEIDELPKDCVGFVYCITNLITNKKYIGKKTATFSKTSYKTIKQKNGIKKRKKIKSKLESDWKIYTGSNIELNKDIKQLGIENFTREILYFCKSKAECSYIEAKVQFEKKVLETNDYYNNYIQVRVHGNHILNKINQ